MSQKDCGEVWDATPTCLRPWIWPVPLAMPTTRA
jgi:hypothetical protein